MPKTTVVVFGQQGARIHSGANPDDFRGRGDVLVNPIIPRGVPPHLWEKHEDLIRTITQSEFDAKQGVKAPRPPRRIPNWVISLLTHTTLAALGFALGAFLG